MEKHLVNESLELALAHTQIQNTRDAQNVIKCKACGLALPLFFSFMSGSLSVLLSWNLQQFTFIIAI